MPLDEAHGAAGDGVGEVPRDLDGSGVLEEVVGFVRANVRVIVHRGTAKAEELVEAVRVRRHLRLEAEVPLPDQSRDVPVLLEQCGERETGRGKATRGIDGDAQRHFDPPSLLVLAADEPCTGRRAGRAVRVGIGEPDPLAGESVEVRCPHIGCAVAADVAVAQVVHDDEDDVRPVSAALRVGRYGEKGCCEESCDEARRHHSHPAENGARECGLRGADATYGRPRVRVVARLDGGASIGGPTARRHPTPSADMLDTIKLVFVGVVALLFVLATAARRFPEIAWLQPFRDVFPQRSDAEQARARRRVNAYVGAELILLGVAIPFGYAALKVMLFSRFTTLETVIALGASLLCIVLGIMAIRSR